VTRVSRQDQLADLMRKGREPERVVQPRLGSLLERADAHADDVVDAESFLDDEGLAVLDAD
jgi:hypothetical protein